MKFLSISKLLMFWNWKWNGRKKRKTIWTIIDRTEMNCLQTPVLNDFEPVEQPDKMNS